MKLTNKTILLISPEPWGHIFVSKHHYAVNLAKRDNKVFFLNPPSNNSSLKKTQFREVYTVDYKGFLPGVRFLPAFIQKRLIREQFDHLQKFCKVKFDIIWSFDNSVFFDFSALPKSLIKISHIVDLNQNFMSARAFSTADICFGVTKEIVDRSIRFNQHSYFINHGYNASHKVMGGVNLSGNNLIRCMYLGNLAMKHLDWELIRKLVLRFKNVDFWFVGPDSEEKSMRNSTHEFKEEVIASSNVRFFPKISSDQILEYLRMADILLIAYQEQYHLDQSNSHKMMEYLASGKPIVASWTAEYASLSHEALIAMPVRNSEVPEKFAEVIEDLEGWNSVEKSSKRIAYALDNTYDRQLDRIEDKLNML